MPTDKIAIPSWQQIPAVTNNKSGASSTLRNGPDVAANAGFSFYVCANNTNCTANEVGGTSFAAPMWAAYVALANEQAATSGTAPAGFINPTIYAQNVTSSYATNFHDIKAGISGKYSALTGYDLVTGWGSPTPALIGALIGQSTRVPSSSFTLSVNPTLGAIGKGSSGTALVSVQTSDGFNSNVALSASGAPAGMTVSFSASSIAPGNSCTMTVTVANKVPKGSYTITITGTGDRVSQTTTFPVTVS